MKRTVDLDIDLYADDIVDFIVNADSKTQADIIRGLSKVHYRKVGTFLIQLGRVVDDIKEYDHDTQNNIKRMIEDIREYICEVDNETGTI